MTGREPRVLLVEDTYALAETYRAYLEPDGMTVEIVASGAETLEFLKSNVPDAIVLDVNLPDVSGLELLRKIKADGLPCEIVVITGQASVNLAVDAMREGAFDFIMKPFSAERLRVTMRNALEHRKLTDTIEELGAEMVRDRFQDFIGRSFAMQTVYRVLQNAAPTNATVFVTGESGTGKELCARALHALSKRADRPFVTINCAAIPHDLLESEIFGHVKGAFTGATSDRKGAALSADGGTLFLDEICEMDLALQSKMLRFLQEKSVQRVGEDTPRPANVRIVCATNRDPLAEVRSGRFREDLYYRLHVVPVELPPLRDRDDDVLLIARHYLKTFSAEDGKAFVDFSPEAEQALLSYDWPGNVRQLENVIRTAVVLNDGRVIERDMLAREVRTADHRPEVGLAAHAADRKADARPAGATAPAAAETGDIKPLDEVIRATIEQAITRCGGSVPRAAAALRVSPSTIYRRMQAWQNDEDTSSVPL